MIIIHRVYTGYILDSYPLPLFRRLTRRAAIEKNFFWFLFFWFARNLSEVWIENILNFTLVILISNFFYFFSWLRSYRIRTRFYSEYLRFNSLSFARYSSSDFHIEFTSSRLRFSTLIIILDSVFFRFYISTRFYSLNFPCINFGLFQHCLFYTLTLRLFISPACYKQTSMLM